MEEKCDTEKATAKWQENQRDWETDSGIGDSPPPTPSTPVTGKSFDMCQYTQDTQDTQHTQLDQFTQFMEVDNSDSENTSAIEAENYGKLYNTCKHVFQVSMVGQVCGLCGFVVFLLHALCHEEALICQSFTLMFTSIYVY